MTAGMDYWLGQLLSLIFYIMTLIVYNRARKEYVGGKIAAAINLIMIFLLILFLNDFVDYFLATLIHVEADVIAILKILIKLVAICVLFFGGLRFFATQQRTADTGQDADLFAQMDSELPAEEPAGSGSRTGTLALEMPRQIQKPTLGRYEILGQIGKGAMGIVYKGRDPKLNRLTAIKTIRFIDEFNEDKVEEIKAHFYREAEVVAKLSHKNIVTIFDVGEDLDVSYLAMEYLEGESLEQFTMQRELLPVYKCMDIIIQVCEALDYAHRQGIIHRDIKPGNIMMLENGLVKVTDFGIARAAGSTKTRTGIIKGTPFYMSPEQARGAVLTGASDIFSLGIVFYQLLTGKLPFTGDNLAAIMFQTANVDPEPADSFNQSIGRAVLDILNKSLKKRPEDRFKSAKEMADALRKVAVKPAEAASEELKAGPATGQAIIPEKSISGIQQVRDKRIELEAAEDAVNFEDLEQVLSEGALSETGGEEYYPTTEDMPVEEGRDSGRSAPGFRGKDEKLDLSELREVLAERKRRLAREDDAQAAEGDEGVAPEGKPVQEGWRWRSAILRDPNAKRGFPFFGRSATSVLSIVLTLIALAGAFYYFWLSPNSEYRIVKILYARYFPAKGPTREDMLAEQKRLVERIMKDKLLEKQQAAQLEQEHQAAAEEKFSQAEETQREQQRIVQEAMEAEKKAEDARLAQIEAERRQERERLARIEAEKQKEQERLARIAEEKRKSKETSERLERERSETQLAADVQKIKALLATALQHRNDQNYAAAKETLDKALKSYHESRFQADSRLMELKREIENALTSDEVVYGAKGYLFYEDRWVSPQEYDRMRLGEGYVRYKDDLVKYRTLDKVIIGKTRPVVYSFLAEKFKGTMVHSKNIKLNTIALEQNSSASSTYTVHFKWEVWTFKGLEEGACPLTVSYHADEDKWYLIKGCE